MQPVTELESLEHLKNIRNTIGPYLVPLVALVIYTLNQREKTQAKLEQTLTDHVIDDDKIHDKLFTEQRLQGERIAKTEQKQDDCERCP